MKFQKHFEEISRIRVGENDTLDDVLFRIGEKLCYCLHVQRVNVWVFKKDPNRIECQGNVSISPDLKFSKGEILFEKDIPSYFSHLSSDEVICIHDVSIDPISAELRNNYCQEYQIKAIMDVPVRIEGVLSGVICFEDCKRTRNWDEEEIQFAQAVSQIVSLTIENQKRKSYQRKLVKALDEKSTLLVEMHHRLKNNLTMLISLLRLQSRQISDSHALSVIEDFEHQMLSISKLHEQLYNSGNYLEVELNSYLKELITGFRTGLSATEIIYDGVAVNINSDKAVTLGLVVNEIMANALKYGHPDSGSPIIFVSLKVKPTEIRLDLRDNGKGFVMDEKRRESFGISLIYDLSEQIGVKVNFSSSPDGSVYALILPIS